MDHLRRFVIFLSLPVIVIVSVKNKPKCMQNFLKGQKPTRLDDREAGLEEINIENVLGDLEGPTSERVYLENIPSTYRDCQYFVPGTFNPDPSVLIDFNNGRLGNQMSSLASTFCLARELKLDPMMTHRTSVLLTEYFPAIHSLATVLESKFCSPWSDLQYTALSGRSGTTGQVLVLPPYPNLLNFYPKYFNILKGTFNFNEKYQLKASNFMNKIKRKVNHKNPILVSIHVRRKDHKYTFNGGGDSTLTKQYYQNAIQLAKDLYGQVVFIVVSDELEWCKDNLSSDHLFYTDNTDTVEGTGTDLAVLTNCNHSVVSHGTFGFWGAMLAGGDVIAPPNYQLPKLDSSRKIYFVNKTTE